MCSSDRVGRDAGRIIIRRSGNDAGAEGSKEPLHEIAAFRRRTLRLFLPRCLSHRDELFDVAFQDCEQLAELAFSFGGILGLFDAMPDMRMNELFSERFEAAARGNNLSQYLHAILIVLQHPLDGAELAGDLARPDNRSAPFLLGMSVLLFGHKLLMEGRA